MDQGRSPPRVYFRGLEVACVSCAFPVPYDPTKSVHYCLDCDPERLALIKSKTAGSTTSETRSSRTDVSTPDHFPSFNILEVPCRDCKEFPVSCDTTNSALCNRCRQVRTKNESERGNHGKGQMMKPSRDFGTAAFTSRDRLCRDCSSPVQYDPNRTLYLCEPCVLAITIATRPAGYQATSTRSNQHANTSVDNSRSRGKSDQALDMDPNSLTAVDEGVAGNAVNGTPERKQPWEKPAMYAETEPELLDINGSYSFPPLYDADGVRIYDDWQGTDWNIPASSMSYDNAGGDTKPNDFSFESHLEPLDTPAEPVEDLFTSTFGGNPDNDGEDDKHSDASSDVVIVGSVSKTEPVSKGKGKKGSGHTTTAQAKHGRYIKKIGGSGCTGPDPVNDVSPSYKYLRDFHNRAVLLIPRLPLADERYWIGVLHLGRRPGGSHHEKHFKWMKGNRLTTVSTVWHAYQSATATDGFVLLLGLERVKFTDRMEELDYFNQRKIMFRTVEEGHADAKGREMCEGVVPRILVEEQEEEQPEVIELD